MDELEIDIVQQKDASFMEAGRLFGICFPFSAQAHCGAAPTDRSFTAAGRLFGIFSSLLLARPAPARPILSFTV